MLRDRCEIEKQMISLELHVLSSTGYSAEYDERVGTKVWAIRLGGVIYLVECE